MKTTIMTTPLLKGNVFKIENFEDYQELIVVTVDGVNKVTMSFPWHKSIPESDPILRRAVKECVDKTTESLLQYLNRSKVQAPAPEVVATREDPWLLKVLKREFGYLAKMCGGGDGK